MAAMVTGAVTSQPIGHYEFCHKYATECSIKSRSAPSPKVSAKGWAAVRQINRAVNARYIAKTDKEVYGREEVWSYPSNFADCEDFALEKRKELAAQGFALSDLLMTVVRKPDGEGHAVLTLRTSDGDFILDNLDNEVKPWFATPYTFLKRQASFNTGRWGHHRKWPRPAGRRIEITCSPEYRLTFARIIQVAGECFWYRLVGRRFPDAPNLLGGNL
jgi:predicted transglutaminase-like cysteine proteinase